MCTDNIRATTGPVVATRRSIPLRRRPPTLSRRHLLHRAGLGAAGVAILAACGSDGAATAPDATPSTPDEPPVATDPDAPTTSSEVPVEGPDAASELRLEWVELGFVSAYVLARGREAAVVDTGTPGSGAAVVEALAALGLQPADVRHIVLTHDHGDHVGGLAELEVMMTNATVSAGPGDVDDVATALPLQEVGDGDEVFGMAVVHTPGHTPGSISVVDADTGLLVAGDAVNGDGAGGLLGPNERFSADMPTALASVGDLAALAPEVVAFGHGGAPVTDDVPRRLAALAAG